MKYKLIVSGQLEIKDPATGKKILGYFLIVQSKNLPPGHTTVNRKGLNLLARDPVPSGQNKLHNFQMKSGAKWYLNEIQKY